MNRDNNQNPQPFIMFICSLLPGCAHMYLGLIKRGVQLLLAFTLLIGIVAAFDFLGYILVPALVVLYVYSFFDGYSIYRNLKAGKVVEDESVIEGLESLRKILSNGYWVGLVLVILGIVAAFNNIANLEILNERVYEILEGTISFIPAIALLSLGIFLMAKGNKQRKANKAELERPTE